MREAGQAFLRMMRRSIGNIDGNGGCPELDKGRSSCVKLADRIEALNSGALRSGGVRLHDGRSLCW